MNGKEAVMKKVVTIEQMRHMDRQTIENLGVPGIILMENAGYQSYVIADRFCRDNHIETIHVFTGKGNNGGDGFVIARHLHKNNYKVVIHPLEAIGALQGDAAINAHICEQYRIPTAPVASSSDLPLLIGPSLIIDALLGTGIKGAVRGIYKDVIEWMNAQYQPVISIDIPSGLNGDSATTEGEAVDADLTITMALPKCAHLFYPARAFTGQLEVVDIGIPDFIEHDEHVRINLVEENDVFLPSPPPWQNKYSAGTLFILAGGPGMTGAATMAARAAGITGAGLVFLGIPSSLNTIAETSLTETLTLPLPADENGFLTADALPRILEKIDEVNALLIGPGMGRAPQTQEIIKAALEHAEKTNKPTVVDADALFYLSTDDTLCNRLGDHFILTPHYGEFMRISGHKKLEMQSVPWKVLEEFLSSHECTVNLKGAPSIAGSREKGLYINPTGNEGLAKGGSGDILAGLIAGFLSRGISPLQASISGNYFHGQAADLAADEIGITTYTPMDLIPYLQSVIR